MSPKAQRGSKSARVSRNGLVQRWDVGDAEDAIQRFEELEFAMIGLVKAISARVRRIAV